MQASPRSCASAAWACSSTSCRTTWASPAAPTPGGWTCSRTGRTSVYADFFDIDWRPLKEELRGKVLLPILGDHYGVVLESGELRLEYADGAFRCTTTRPACRSPRRPTRSSCRSHCRSLEQTLPEDDRALLELQSIITAFERLPPQDERDPERIAERQREQIVVKRRLADLSPSSPEVARASRRRCASSTAMPAIQSATHGFDALDRLLDAQSYRLASLRTAGEEINYRRFFDINELAAIRQEDPEVFAATHALLLRLIASGVVTGLRIDHPDGLWDPAGYFRDCRGGLVCGRATALRQTARRRERSPAEPETEAGAHRLGRHRSRAGRRRGAGRRMMVSRWPSVSPSTWWWRRSWSRASRCRTTGRWTARSATSLPASDRPLRRPANQRAFDDLYARFTRQGRRRPFAELGLRSQRADHAHRAGQRDQRAGAGTGPHLRAEPPHARLHPYACATPCARSSPASRSTAPTSPATRREPMSERDRRAIVRAVALAKRRNPATDPSVFDFLATSCCCGQIGTRRSERAGACERCRFVMKFQQLTGPVMAKGVEDTAFYVYNRLVSLNEVGGDPAAFGTSVAEFHRQNAERARRWPHGLLTSSTHDTKRSEDVRARIAVLSELPREWRAAVNRWARLNRRAQDPRRGRLRAGPQRRVPALPDPARRLALGRGDPRRGVRRPDRGVHAEGDARGAGPHQLDQPDRPTKTRCSSSCAPRSTPRGRTRSWTTSPRCGRWSPTPARSTPSRNTAQADRPRRAGRLPGDGAVGPQPGRPRQPPPGRLRAAQPPLAGVSSGVAPAAGWPPICSRRKRTGG